MMTVITLPDDKCTVTLPIGTVVYAMNHEHALDRSMTVVIEARGSTNYDNQRRAVDFAGIHLFWVQGKCQTL
jgi:hypothetical protein